MVPGFELTTSRTWSSSHNHWTRAPAHSDSDFLPTYYTQVSGQIPTKQDMNKIMLLYNCSFQTVWPEQKTPNVYKSCPKMISLQKLKLFTPLQKLPKNEGDFKRNAKRKCFSVRVRFHEIKLNIKIWLFFNSTFCFDLLFLFLIIRCKFC